MPTTSTIPGQLGLSLWQALRAAHDLKVMLIDNTWAYDPDVNRFVSEVTGEVTGTGYTAGGATLANVTETYDAATDTTIVNADDVVWDATGGALTGHRAVFYVDTGTPTSSPIVTAWDLGADITATNAAWTLSIDAGGIFRLAA
ncbi:MAG TPA: hypothetical protein VFJ19_09270 [Nocardioidaceae bacterium]|nr:hypothetical protein [Nocardioidaceae bacterium]